MKLAALDAHLRFAGALIRAPRRALAEGLTHGAPRMEGLFPYVMIAAAAAEPLRAGQAFLLARIALFDGLLLFLNLVVRRFAPALIGAFVAAAILWLLDRRRHSYDRLSTLTAWMLLPYLVLCTLGGALEAAGLDLWFLPHHELIGAGLTLTVRALVAFSWPLALFALLFTELRAQR